MDVEIWLCFWRDGAPVFGSLAGSQKGSQRLAKRIIAVDRWKLCKDRGIRCQRVEISAYDADKDKHDAEEHVRMLKTALHPEADRSKWQAIADPGELPKEWGRG